MPPNLRAAIVKRGAELRLALRVTVSGVLAYALANLLNLPQGLWAVLTAVIVVQASLGASIKAAVDRFSGTVCGAIAGAAIAVIVPHANGVTLALALAVAIAPLAFLAAVNASFRVAPITALIMLLPTMVNQHIGPIETAFDRVLEIALGDVVGLTVALIVLPARAHAMVAERASRILALFAELAPALLAGLTPMAERPSVAPLHQQTRANLKKLEAAAEEALRERVSRVSAEPEAEPLVRTLYRIRHDLVMLGRSSSKPLPETLYERLKAPLADISAAATALFAGLAGEIAARPAGASLLPFPARRRKPRPADHQAADRQAADRQAAAGPAAAQPEPPAADALPAWQAALAELETALDAFSAGIVAIRRERLTRDLPGDTVANLFALGFALEQLRQDARDLAARIAEWSRPGDSVV